jgi:hypothetical protein
MSEEQDNQMEQWLKEYAKKRRSELDEPIEMHEATRTMLQGEVSRVYPKSVETQPQPRDSSAWMAWAIGGATVGVAAIVITYVSNFPQDQNPVELAKVDEVKPAAVGGSERVEESGKASGEPVSKSVENGKTQTATVDGQNSPARRIAPTDDKDNSRASGSVKGNPGGAAIESARAATSNHTAPKQPVAGGFAPEPVNALKRDATFYNNIRELRQDFTQSNLAVANRKNILPKAVLVNFQVQRTGNQVRVVDQDGSVYTGNVINEEQYSSGAEDKVAPAKLSVASARAGASGAPRAPASLPAPEAQRKRAVSRGQFYFRVQGFNRTLRKEVVLEATLDSPPEKPVASGKLIALKSKGRAKENEQLKTAEATEVKKELSDQDLRAVGNLQTMRVLGNARIEKANYAVDAYIQQSASPIKAIIKPAPAKPSPAGEK